MSFSYTRQLILATLSALVALGVTACGDSPTTPSQVPAPAPPPPPPSAPGPLVHLTGLFLGDAELPFGIVPEKPDADGGYTLKASTLYTIWFAFTGSASGRCVATKFSYSWSQSGTFGDCKPTGPTSGIGYNFTTPGADAALDLQSQRITVVVEERGPDLPEPRAQTIEIQVRVTTAPAQPNPTIFSQGTLDIPQTYAADLDRGLLANDASADIWFEAVTRTARFLTPIYGATLAKAGPSAPGRDGCAALTLSPQRIDLAELGTGSYLCVKTNGSRLAQVRVAADPGPDTGAGSTLRIEFVTFAQ